MKLARGLPLAFMLALSACSSSVPRDTPQAPLADTEATGGAARSSTPSVANAVNSPVARESRKPVTATPSEQKNGVAGRSIYFSAGDATLSDESIQVLREHAEYLKRNPKQLIVLRAYLDSLGSRTYSVAIVQKRLNVVAEKLREQGVPKSRIRQVMLGQQGKKQNCESPSCQNRGQRIEILFK